MKKYILLILSFFVMMTVKAEGDMPIVDGYIEDQAYSEGVLVTNTWAYDTTIDMYVKLDETGHIIMTLDNPNNDPTAIKGKINIKAKVNSSFDDKKINIILISDSYRYSFTLDKSNNFEINDSINVDSYEITYVHVNDDNEYSIDYPSDINVYDNKALDPASLDEIEKMIQSDAQLINTSIEKSDHILALSTCTEPVSSNRLIVFAYIYE